MVKSPEVEDEEQVNDPGNEDPGSLMDDAEVPLIDLDEVEKVGHVERPGIHDK